MRLLCAERERIFDSEMAIAGEVIYRAYFVDMHEKKMPLSMHIRKGSILHFAQKDRGIKEPESCRFLF